jgi:ethanolamine transporter EutH
MWFFAGMTSHSGGDRTYWEEGRRWEVGVLAGLVTIAFNVLPCGLIIMGLLDEAGDSLVGRMLLGALGVVCSLFVVIFWLAIAMAGLAFVPDELFDWLREQGTRLGAGPYAVLAVLVAGVAAGVAGSVCGIAMSAVVTSSLDPLPMSVLYWWFGAGPVAFVAGKVLLAAQFAVSEACTRRVVYRLLARKGELPPLPGKFLAWADSRILLRRTGDRYVFLHRLYRDWWAAQP